MVLELGSLLGGVGGAIGNIAILAGAGKRSGQKERKQLDSLVAALKTSDFDFTKLGSEDLQLIAEFLPNVYEAIVPDEVKQINDSPELRDSQVRGLTHLERVAEQGIPLGERLAAQEQGRRISRESGRVDKGIVENLRRRGRAGGGTELQARFAGAQNASELARGLGSDLQQDAVQNRLQAAQAAAGLAGNIRGQDINLRGRNVDSVNRFNQFASSLMTGAARDNALERSRAQFLNEQNRQRVSDTNILNRQGVKFGERDRIDRLKQIQFNQDLSKLNLRARTLSAVATGQDAIQAANAQAIRGIGQGFGQGTGGILGGFGGGGKE